ncbi:hypothetical protein [Melioribacter sp. OK-6-Me]|uniref:hypothetical protein n=1 Tax=unclassified Melioribacter TaxID=2627329 RepID=UPI003EDB3712
MNEQENEVLLLDAEQRKKANEFIVKHLQSTMLDGKMEIHNLRFKLSATYWVIVILSIIMFILGVLLLSVPLKENVDEIQSLISGGLGLADLTALFLFKPIERIHKLMGDMSQIVIALNSYQTQVGLRLMEMDSTNRKSIGETSVYISSAARESIKVIQDYFESTALKSH